MSMSGDPYEPLWSTYTKMKRTREVMQARLNNGALNRDAADKKHALEQLKIAQEAIEEAFETLFPESPK